MNFSLDFGESNTYTLELCARDTSVGRRWYQLLSEHVERDNRCSEPQRLYNFPKDPWDEEALVQELNRCISIINDYQKVINHNASVGMSQETFNELHHYFEVLRGEVIEGTEFFNKAPRVVQDALNDYNVCIHRTESFYMGKRWQRRAPRIVCTLNNIERQLLETEDYENFVTDLPAGTAFVNYCQVGKPILDVFRDGDEIIFDDTVRPLKYLGPDFSFYLANTQEETNGLAEWMSANGYDINDKTNAIGVLPVADVIWKDDPETTILEISKRQYIKCITIKT